MEEGSKRRLVGTAVVVMLLVVFLPMLLEEESTNPVPDSDLEIPPRPEIASDAQSDGESADASTTEEDRRPAMPQLPAPDRYEPPATTFQALPETLPAARPADAPGPASDSEPAPLPVADPAPAPDPAPAGGMSGMSGMVSGSTPDPVPASPTLDGPGWVVQVSSLTEQNRARSLEQELRAKGFPAFIERAQVNGKTYHRVRVGPRAERRDIEAMAASLRSKAGYKGQILRYP
jgi:DedD protein